LYNYSMLSSAAHNNKTESLQAEISELKAANNSLRAEVNSLKEQAEQTYQAYESLRQQVVGLLRNRYGKRSERCVDKDGNPQPDMFADDLESYQEQADKTKEEEKTEVASHRRKKKKRDTSNYPREIQIIPVPEEEKQCACGCEKTVIRYETRELFDYQPAVFRIIEQRREVVACPKSCEQSIQTAPVPLQVLPKIMATESLLANIVVSKIHHRQPLYHLEKYVSSIGASRETMARWVVALVKPLQPLFNLMKDEVVDYDVASIDATTLQVLKEPGRLAETKSYVYCIRGGPPDKSVILYGYNNSEHKAYVDNWFEDFKGSVHMDADSFFHQLLADPAVQPSFCHSHVRRKFEAVMKAAKKQGLAHEAVRIYKKLYRIERQAKDDGMSSIERHQLRQQSSRPLMEEFKLWLDKYYPLIVPKSPLGKAFAYAIKYWQGLNTFLSDGRLEIDNNLTEQQIKPFVIARKNFMFADSMAGAGALCMHFSMVRTALAHNLDPYQYYVAILKQLPHCQLVEDYEKLLPWNIALD
jgi:transposase